VRDRLTGWNTGGSKWYRNSGFDRHNKYYPTATAADGHSIQFQVPAYNPGGAAPAYYPGLGDTRIDTSPLWTTPGAVLYMRDFNSTAGF
jgi:hypothetical protein